jgi:hypothetical protein
MRTIGRRRFLRETVLGSTALFLAPPLLSRHAGAQITPGIARELSFFSQEEYFVFSTAAARLTGHGEQGTGPQAAATPGTGAAIDAALRADRFLSTEDPEIQDQIHILLTIFNSAIAAFLLSFRFSRFTEMDAAAQDAYIDGWMTSSLNFRRTAFQALKRLSMSMYYTDEGAWEEIGYHGLELPGDSR